MENTANTAGALHGIDRLNAYIDFLERVYQVDDRGLADLAGIKLQSLTKARRAKSLDDVFGGVFFKLVDVTRINPDWLLR